MWKKVSLFAAFAVALSLTSAASAQNGINSGNVLSFNAMPGDTISIPLDFFFDAESDFSQSIGVALTASQPGLTATDATSFLNPDITAFGNPTGLTRWGSVQQGTLNGSSTDLWTNASGFSVCVGAPCGIEKAKDGVGSIFLDSGYDAATGGFRVADFVAQVSATASGSIDIFYTVGNAPNGIDNRDTDDLPFQVGNSTINGAKTGQAPVLLATINVDGGMGGSIVEFPAEGDPDASFDNNGVPQNFAVGGDTVLVNTTSAGPWDLFVDLGDDSAAAGAVADINGEGGSARLGPFSFGGVNYDLAIGFGAAGQARLNLPGIDSVGVPEPSSIVLAILGMIGFVGYGVRRRRSK